MIIFVVSVVCQSLTQVWMLEAILVHPELCSGTGIDDVHTPMPISISIPIKLTMQKKIIIIITINYSASRRLCEESDNIDV